MTKDNWTGCYPSNWKGLIVPEAMAHPAKFSNKLIRRIYEHMLAEGWVKPGDRVLDPFGGVALGALDAMRLGLHWTGIELEEKFHELGQAEYLCLGINPKDWRRWYSRPKMLAFFREHHLLCPTCERAWNDIADRKIPHRELHIFRGNIPLWTHKFQSMPNFGTARLLHGDSRKLLELLDERAQVAVSSPPYADSVNSDSNGIDWSKTKKDYPGRQMHEKRIEMSDRIHSGYNYGSTPGQLGAMKAGGFESVVASPPYSAMQVEKNAKSIDRAKQYEVYRKSGGGQTFEQFCHTQELHSQGYGHSDGNLANMPAGKFKATVSSPPFQKGSEGVMRADKFKDPEAFARVQMTKGNGASFDAKMRSMKKDNERADYGKTPGQLGNDSGDDFWLAARTIVEQVYQALAPGGHAVWVVKNYVKNKQIVHFSDQWRQLCEAVGFVTMHEHHAMLVHHKGTQHTLEGGTKIYTTASKSFFRRLAERKAALDKYWKSLDRAVQFIYLKKSHHVVWQDYNALSDEEKKAIGDDGELKNTPPNKSGIKNLAEYFAFTDSGEREETWNKETRIDWETIYCMEKP